ncbi:hypothetical protein C2G38_2151601 [Gigaspora rosea]|uniref:Uncharacterized protein n=1 Tax=Gigaspora rosea TaxID=44941 RepID=A0A397WAJ4_9GLOM|nr:hypothetical protein C2G38_2151601 [Gigaspora rosea]
MLYQIATYTKINLANPLLIPFVIVKEYLEEYNNYLKESYIIYESEDVAKAKISVTFTNSNIVVIAVSNNEIDNNNNNSQHKLSQTTRLLQSKSKLFIPFKPLFKKAKISNSKH